MEGTTTAKTQLSASATPSDLPLSSSRTKSCLGSGAMEASWLARRPSVNRSSQKAKRPAERRRVESVSRSASMQIGAASSTKETSCRLSSSETSHFRCRDLQSPPSARPNSLPSSVTIRRRGSLIWSWSRLKRPRTSSKQLHLRQRANLPGGSKTPTKYRKIKSCSSRLLDPICMRETFLLRSLSQPGGEARSPSIVTILTLLARTLAVRTSQATP